jgi:hypothetical protein
MFFEVPPVYFISGSPYKTYRGCETFLIDFMFFEARACIMAAIESLTLAPRTSPCRRAAAAAAARAATCRRTVVQTRSARA